MICTEYSSGLLCGFLKARLLISPAFEFID